MDWIEKIDVSKVLSKAEALLIDGAVEGAFTTKSSNIIFGELWAEGEEVSAAIQVFEKTYKFYCSVCSGNLCPHAACLILCYLKEKESFIIQEECPLSLNLDSAIEFFMEANKQNSNLTSISARKKKAMQEGMNLAHQILVRLFESGNILGNSQEISIIKEQASRLDEFYLPGLKLMFIELVEKLLIKKPDEYFLYDLEKLNTVISKSIEEIDLIQNTIPYSIFQTLRGHVWKYKELLQMGQSFDGRLMQFYFYVNENLVAERLEEVSYWVELSSGEIYQKVNYRPFKALRHIPEDDTVFEVFEAKGIVKYPGDVTPRIRWESFTLSECSPEDFQSILNHAEPFSAGLGKELKELLRDRSYEPLPIKLIKAERLFESSAGLYIESESIKISLKNCNETEVLSCLTLEDFSEAALFLQFDINFDDQVLEAKPLSIVFEDRMMRLGI